MGNSCSQKKSTASTNTHQKMIRIMTDTGRIMELQGPMLAQQVLDDFPGYGIYQKGQLSLPLFEDELLFNGEVYYILPFGETYSNVASPTVSFSESLSFRRDQSSAIEVLPWSGDGVWKVKMAIDSRELGEMLNENAEGLIQMMRTAAKSCSQPSPGRSFGWRSVGLISCRFKIPACRRRLIAR